MDGWMCVFFAWLATSNQLVEEYCNLWIQKNNEIFTEYHSDIAIELIKVM